MLRIWSVVLILLLLGGCPESSLLENPTTQKIPENRPNNVQSNKDAHTVEQIRAVLAQTPQCPEKLIEGTGNCEPIEITFEKKNGFATGTRQRVLIIDSGMWEEALLILSPRVLDFVEADNNGRLNTINLSGTFAKGAKRIFHEIIGNNPQISWHSLRGLHKDIFNKLVHPFPGTKTGPDHGFDILSTIAELSPDAEFVISQTPHHKAKVITENICFFASDENARLRIVDYYRNLTDSHKALIKEYSVRYINLSSGHTLHNVKSHFTNCTPEVANDESIHLAFLDLLLEEYYRPLGSVDGVALVQAGVLSPKHELTPDDADYPIDCAHISNRIRVGEVSWAKSEQNKTIPKAQSDALACIDVVLNKGPRNWDILDAIFDGTFTNWDEIYCASSGILFPCQLGTSYTAPLMVSHLIYLSEVNPQLNMEEIIEMAKEDGLNVIKDPGAKGEFMRFVRDGHRS